MMYEPLEAFLSLDVLDMSHSYRDDLLATC
jgi:hypothetical protein